MSKKRINAYVNEQAHDELRAMGVNISEEVNRFLIELASEKTTNRAKLKKEIDDLEEKLEVKQAELDQINQRENRLGNFLEEKTAYGYSRVSYYNNRVDDWTDDEKERYLEQTKESAPIETTKDEIERKILELINSE